MRLEPLPPNPRSMRWANVVMAALYFLTAGLLVYFRLGPVQDVLARLERDGARVAPWVPLLFTVGTFTAAGYLSWQGYRAVRRIRRAGGAPGGSGKA